jgi:hypothetical protein
MEEFGNLRRDFSGTAERDTGRVGVRAGNGVPEPAGIAERVGKLACGHKNADKRGERNGTPGQYRWENDTGKRNAREMVTLKAREESGSWGAAVRDLSWLPKCPKKEIAPFPKAYIFLQTM